MKAINIQHWHISVLSVTLFKTVFTVHRTVILEVVDIALQSALKLCHRVILKRQAITAIYTRNVHC